MPPTALPLLVHGCSMSMQLSRIRGFAIHHPTHRGRRARNLEFATRLGSTITQVGNLKQ